MRFCGALLRLAARRWPADIRDQMLRAWLGELHVLALQRKRLAMLAFAVSLLVSRPAKPPILVPLRPKQTGYLVLFGGPAAGIAILVGCLVIGLLPIRLLSAGGGVPTVAYAVLFTVAPLAASAWMVRQGLRWGAGSTLGAPATAAIAVGLTVPLVPFAVAVAAGLGSAYILPLMTWWPPALLVLTAAATLAQKGRVRAAWALGGLGTALPIGAACLLHALVAEIPLRETLVGAPQLLLVLSAYALSYVVGVARSAGAMPPQAVPLRGSGTDSS